MKTKISILLAAFAITAFSLVSSPTLSTMNAVFADSFDPFSFGSLKSLGLDKLFDQSTSNDKTVPNLAPNPAPNLVIQLLHQAVIPQKVVLRMKVPVHKLNQVLPIGTVMGHITIVTKEHLVANLMEGDQAKS